MEKENKKNFEESLQDSKQELLSNVQSKNSYKKTNSQIFAKIDESKKENKLEIINSLNSNKKLTDEIVKKEIQILPLVNNNNQNNFSEKSCKNNLSGIQSNSQLCKNLNDNFVTNQNSNWNEEVDKNNQNNDKILNKSLIQNNNENLNKNLFENCNELFFESNIKKYGGIYIEVTEVSETYPSDDSSSPPKTNKIISSHLYKTLEGMDPVTGDFIRDVLNTKDLDNKNEQTNKNNCTCNLEELDPKTGNYIKSATQKTKDSYKKDNFDSKQLTITSLGQPLRREWSKRLASTLRNKNRNPDDSDEDSGANNCIFGNQIRFTIMIISTLCLSSILSNILTFNFTFICMSGPRPQNFSNMSEDDLKLSSYNPNLDYSSAKRSALFMAVAVGALLTVFPLTLLLNKFGSRLIFGLLGYISAISTFLIPLSAKLGFFCILFMRVIQGTAFSACLPVMGSITSHWSTIKQNGIFIAILSSFLQIAPIFTMPISGELCTSSMGWETVYYLHGTVCLILFTIFIFYHRNSPIKHPLMHRKELVKVMIGKGSIYSGPGRTHKSKAVPYNALYKDIAIWAIFVAAFGNFMGTQLSLQFMPTYINKVLFLPIEQTGIASAISPIIMFIIKLIAGQSSDRITFISDQWKLRIYNTLSMGLMGCFFIVLAILDPYQQKSLCLIFLILSTCILGFNSGGFFKSSQMVSRQHSHFTLANISFLNCVCMLFVPLLNEVIAPENTPESWSIVLWIHGIILITTNLFFCIFASSRPAQWTMDSWTHQDNLAKTNICKRQTLQRVAPIKPNNLPQNGFH